jgi:murein L,D-transpeptidase YcbB/YkuD
VSPAGPPDQEVDLRTPTPVYIVYLTVFPTARGLVSWPDIYDRDRPLSAAIRARAAQVAESRMAIL